MTPALPSPSSLSRASSTATTTTTSAPATAPPADRVYKGKYTNRSWQQLPPELVRTIATYHLLNVQLSNYCPLTWDAKELWHSRLVYTTLRDALDLERLMHVTPAWAAALETHLFWTKACALLDPHDVLAHHAIVRPPLAAVPPPSAPGPGGAAVSPQQQQQQQSQQPYRLTPYRHFRQMTARSCYVCRINSPYASTGLSSAKRIYHTTTLGPIILCKDHRKTMFCGLCLREAPPAECDPPLDIHGNTLRFSGYQQQAYGLDRHLAMSLGGVMPPTHTMAFNPALMVCCAENEDEETWPGVDTTCRSCRNEHLWQRISSSMRDREAVGGPRFVPPGYSPSSIRSSKKNRSMLMSRYPPAKYASADWETRQTVDAFIDLGEGSIAEVINVAREKFWLRSQTKMPELMEQAVAATRWNGENMEVMTPTVTPATAVAPTHRALSSSTDAVVDDTTAAETQRPSPPPRPTQQQHRPRLRSRSPSPRSAISSPYDDQGSCGEVSEEEVSEEEEEEDPEFLSLTEDAGGIKELAISDWARSRILDGHWCSPADQWYGHSWPAGGGVRDAGEETESEPDEEEEMRDGRAGVGLVKRVVRVPAVHPCPWTLPAQPPSLSPGDMDDIHPRLSTVRAHVPPSFNLCEQAFRAYQKQFQLILFPAMSNLVRRFVIEASTLKCNSGTYNTSNHLMDPAVRVAKMDYEEVLEGLREPGVWFEGFDWVGAMSTHSGSSDGSDHLRYQHHHHRDREEDASSSTSSDSRGSSDVSHTTSPVLSTTTLQTTPSPPPAHDDKIRRNTSNSHNKDKLSSPSSTTAATATPFVSPIPVSPTLEHPKLIHPIPYVPITLTHMAQYSLDTFKMVWRDACAPLFHCRCTICERAMMHANANANTTSGTAVRATSATTQQQQQQRVPVHPDANAPSYAHGQPQLSAVPSSNGPPQVVTLEEVRVVPHANAVAEEVEEEEEEPEEEEFYEEEESEDDAPSLQRQVPPHLQDHHGTASLSIAGTEPSPDHPRATITPRKRSSGDLENEITQGPDEKGIPRIGTPPKRARRTVSPPDALDLGDGVVIVAPADIDAATRNGDECATQESAVASSGNLGLTTTTGTPRQRKRSSEELELNGTTRLSSEVPSSTNDLDKRIGSIKQKRLRVEPSPPSGGEDPYLHLPNKRKICAASTTPRSLSASPPSSVTVVSSTGSSSSEEDKARTKRTSGASAFVDVSVRDPIREKTGLVQGGELDGLYVFEEV